MNHRNSSLIAATVGNFVSATPMVNAVFGLFLIPLSTAFGWPRASVSAVLGIVAVTGALCYPLAGWLADRYGTRRIVLAGNLLFALSLAALSLVDASLARFYLLYALVGVCAALPSTVLYTKLVSGWFVERRGLALGLSAGLGNGAGSTLMPALCGLLLAHYGWRGAYQGLALATVLLGFPVLLLLLRDPPRVPAASSGAINPGAGYSLAQARRSSVFWMILAAVALGAGSMTALFAHVVPMLLDRGIALQRATAILSVFALVCVAWQIAVGHLLDRVGSPRVAAPFYLAALAGVLLFQHATGLPALLAAAALMGIGLGTEYGVLPYYIARYYGLSSYGTIYGAIYGTLVLCMGFTPFLMDLVYDRSGSYDGAIYAIAAALALGGILIGRLPAYDAPRSASPPPVLPERALD